MPDKPVSPSISNPPPLPRKPLRGLYAVTPDSDDDDWLASAVGAAITGGASAVQYRNKGADDATRQRQALRLVETCHPRGIPLIVNDSVEIAVAAGAAGVHLGHGDPDPIEARARLGPHAIIGVSCYDDLELAERVAGIADHVAFGSVFGSSVKPDAVRAPLELLASARARGWNVVAIGGIDASNAHLAVGAGADAVAVITALFGPPPGRTLGEIQRAARELVAALAGIPARSNTL
ncbi:MAG: thiamine phosphate synthase [Gammaproteobacteria bacterium]